MEKYTNEETESTQNQRYAWVLNATEFVVTYFCNFNFQKRLFCLKNRILSCL